MKKEINFQLKSAFASPGFLRLTLVGVIYGIGCFLITSFLAYNDDIIRIPAAYNQFFANGNNSFMPIIFKMMLPFIACAAFSDSYLSDSDNNYIPICITRINAKKYYFSKMIAVFTAGAFVIFLPQILNYLLCLVAYPLNSTIENTLDLWQAETYTVILPNLLFKRLYVLSPYLYFLLYIFISSFAAGVISVIAYQLSYFIKHKIFVLSFMFIVINLWSVLCETYDIPLDILKCIIGNDITPHYFYFFLIMFMYIAAAILPTPFAIRKVKETI